MDRRLNVACIVRIALMLYKANLFSPALDNELL